MNATDEQEECVDQTPKKEKKTKKKKTKTTHKTESELKVTTNTETETKTESELKVTTNTETETKLSFIYANRVTFALVCASVMVLMVFAPP